MEAIGIGLMIIGLLGIFAEVFYFHATAKVSTYMLHGVVSRTVLTIGEAMVVLSGEGALISAVIVVVIIWALQVFNVKNYKKMKESREAIDELLK